MSNTQEQLIQDIHDRVATMDARVSEDSIRSMIQSYVQSLGDDSEFVRKMRFGAADPSLIGTKYARHNLSVLDIEFMYDVLTSAKSRGLSRGPSEELERTFRAVSDARYLSEDEIRRIDGQAIDGMFPRIDKRNIKAYEAAFRAMDTAESGYGNQLVGAQYVGDLWSAARQQTQVMNLIPSMEMTAPTAYVPVEVDFPELLYVSESTASNSSNYTTVKTGSNRVSLDAKKFVTHQMYSGELEEDSIVPFVAMLRGQQAKSLAFYPDSMILNGDTTNAGTGNINLDDADPADTKHYLAWDGIRHAAIVDATGQAHNVAGAVSLNTLNTLKTLCYDTTYYHNWGFPNMSNDFVYVADVTTAQKIAQLDEVISARIMLGQNANLLNGQVGSFIGHPVLAVDAMSKTEADGKVSTTGSNNVKGQIVAFNPNGVVWGWRRRVKVETERIPATDQNRIVLSLRAGFGRFTPTGAASGIKWTATAYNITL